MHHLALTISWILFTLLAIFLSLNLFIKHKKNNRSDQVKQQVPPGLWKLPIIGNLHNLMGSLPHHALKSLSRKHGDLIHLQLGEVSTFVVSSPQLAKEIVKTHDVAFANRPEFLSAKIILYNCSDLAFAPYGDYWRQMRKICILELLSGKNVRSFGPIRQHEVSQLVSSVREAANAGSKRAINLTQLLSSYSSSVVCRAAFGRSFGRHRDTLLMLVKEALVLSSGFDVCDVFPSWKILHYLSSKPKMLQLRNKIDGILDTIIQEHVEHRARTLTGFGEFGQEDLIDVLLRIKDNGDLQFPITNTHIKAIIIDMFIAGTESSSITVEWAMTEMFRKPHVLVKAQSEVRKALATMGKTTMEEADTHKLSYLKLVIKETLRLHPSPSLILRENMEECEIGGHTIPPKSRVIINVWGIARDPRYWDDPESFIPERFEDSSVDFAGNHYEFLPFGSGRRSCPGTSFGLANIEVPLANLLCYFDWKLPADDANGTRCLDMSETHGLTTPKKHNLLLVPSMYESLGTA
ncbi:OLC1v1005238C1 [Oldenlandia corymbosa var. corymbosa]|uniref:OLC1v1005238C1 n=1 Tax=Oldenlandia corymbosa var. corymbosa TaxID=529605 RepID=A0AAV1DE52_OLDCO|nr:OLC1v1005238C1 [Oldenlandia corymbosa var. corymbosa]